MKSTKINGSWTYELEESDRDYVVAELLRLITTESYDSIVTIFIYSDESGEDAEFDIAIDEYLTQEQLDSVVNKAERDQ